MSSMRTPKRPAQVGAGLDRERHPRLQHRAAARHQVRRLVRVEPDAVAEAVREQLAVAGVGEHGAGGGVDRAGGGAGDGGGAAGVVRRVDRRVDVVVAARRLAHHHHPRDVGRVAVAQAADVDHDRVAAADHRSPTAWCGIAPLPAEPTITSWMCVVAALDQEPLEIVADLALGAPCEAQAGELAEHGVDGGAGAAQRVLLGRVLHRPQRLEQHAGGHELARRSPPAAAARSAPRCWSETATRARRGAAQQLARRARSASVPSAQGATSQAASAGASKPGVTITGSPCERQDRERQPGRDRRVQPRQPAVVGGRADDDGVEAGRGHPLPQPADPLGDQSPSAALTMRSCSRSCAIG